MEANTANVDTPTPLNYAIENAIGEILRKFSNRTSLQYFRHPVKQNGVDDFISTKGPLIFVRPRRLDPKKCETAIRN